MIDTITSVNYITSYRKGQINIDYTSSRFEKVLLVFHANTLVPLRDTLHFGIKPGHFMLYTKEWEKEGRWNIKDAGYVNYFRADQTRIIQTEYNTLAKQKLLSRGILNVDYKESQGKFILHSYSIFPLHKRKLILNLLQSTVEVEDTFRGKTDIFFNTDYELITKSAKNKNFYKINY